MHEVGQEDSEISSSSVMIGENPAVDESPAKRIGNKNDDAFGSMTSCWLSKVAWKSMDFGLMAGGIFGADMTAEAIRARHDG